MKPMHGLCKIQVQNSEGENHCQYLDVHFSTSQMWFLKTNRIIWFKLFCNLPFFTSLSQTGEMCSSSLLCLKLGHLSQMQSNHCQTEQLAFSLWLVPGGSQCAHETCSGLSTLCGSAQLASWQSPLTFFSFIRPSEPAPSLPILCSLWSLWVCFCSDCHWFLDFSDLYWLPAFWLSWGLSLCPPPKYVPTVFQPYP